MGIRDLHRRKDGSVVSYFRPDMLRFWRNLLVTFCLCSWLGHLLEIPYCFSMHTIAGIVEEDYAVRTDPLFIPYLVYGFGALGMTFLLEPLKERILTQRKTVWGALLEMFVLAVLLSAVLETVMGLIINQPDINGEYPYWDNSQLPGNILQQGWIVNDLFIGLMGMVYIWLIFPVVCYWLDNRKGNSNRLAVIIAVVFAACVSFSSLRANGFIPAWLFSFTIF